jgi:hypothetical protein
VPEELVRKEDVASALGARRELGPDYEEAVVDAFVDKVERRLEERMRKAPARREPPAAAVPLGSLGIAIPLLGVAGGTAGFAGVVAVCVAIILVNVAYAAYALRR